MLYVIVMRVYSLCLFFFFNDTATTEIYTLSLHDALPIWRAGQGSPPRRGGALSPPSEHPCTHGAHSLPVCWPTRKDRKSTRLNSSHANISYAVFCLKKKKKLVHEE